MGLSSRGVQEQANVTKKASRPHKKRREVEGNQVHTRRLKIPIRTRQNRVRSVYADLRFVLDEYLEEV